MKQAAKQPEPASEAGAQQKQQQQRGGVDEGTKREMPTAASIERDAPRDVPRAQKSVRGQAPARGGEHADNGND